jgi:hypothetical protein
MAARRQLERTVAPVSGNITFAYESSERSQESDNPGSECQGFVATSLGRSQSASAFASFPGRPPRNVRGVQGDVPEPSPNGIDVHAGAKQMDRALSTLSDYDLYRACRPGISGQMREAVST